MFTIRQGESAVPNRNVLLGEFRVVDLPPGPAGTIHFDMKFDININGILKVTATEKSTGESQSLKIENVVDHSRKERLAKMIDDVNKWRIEEESCRLAENAKIKLENECYRLKEALAGGSMGGQQKQVIMAKCDDVLNWMGGNPRETHEDYNIRLAEVKLLYEMFVK